MKREILNELNLVEDHERECKLATGGLPESIWETYSSFANTNGGTILLGIKEHRDSFTVEGLTDKQIVKYQKDFWSVLNDRNKVSKNILLNHHVRPVAVGEKKILRIDVPAADRHDKPVYIGTDPMKGTYKRDYEGDFLCTEEAVRAMFADQRDVSGDVEVLEEFGLDVLNQDTIKGYRIIFEQLHSGHPWNALENDEFLMKLRAAAKNKNGTLSPTIAGLLFFGEAYHITEVFPNYFLDYREECDDKAVRWLFRTHSNEGDWSGNIYDFFCKVRTRMDDDVAVPFANRRNGYRVDRVAIKVVLREHGSKLARFSNEINFCERNQNKNIIEIYDHGTIGNNMIFYVMPLAKETLRDRIKKHIQHSDAEEIFINILYGLKYAHEKGAYHRDIKPENILFLDETNNAVIADFGIAHFCEEDIIASVKTKASDRMANFQYAAPEQRIKGNAKNVDGRADVYAAGLILVEMFTGELVGAGNYTKISKVAPEYKYLDDVFNELFCQNPNDRLYPVDAIIEKINSYRSKENSDGSN